MAGAAWLKLLPFGLALALASILPPCAAENNPPLMLAKVYHPGIALQDYWVSEKYDGMRGYWDGKQLLTRSTTGPEFTVHGDRRLAGGRHGR